MSLKIEMNIKRDRYNLYCLYIKSNNGCVVSNRRFSKCNIPNFRFSILTCLGMRQMRQLEFGVSFPKFINQNKRLTKSMILNFFRHNKDFKFLLSYRRPIISGERQFAKTLIKQIQKRIRACKHSMTETDVEECEKLKNLILIWFNV